MKFHELLKQLDSLSSGADVKSQMVEAVLDTQKYFLSDIDIKSDMLKFVTSRQFYKELPAIDLINKMKDCKNMVNDDAVCQIMIEGRASDAKDLSGLFVSNSTVELY